MLVQRGDAAQRPAAPQALAGVAGRPAGEVDDREVRPEEVPGLVEVRAPRDLLQGDDVRPQLRERPPDDLLPLPAVRILQGEQVERRHA
jgi:hypothetical protein